MTATAKKGGKGSPHGLVNPGMVRLLGSRLHFILLTETRHPASSEMTPARALSGRVQGLGLDFSGEGKSGLSTPFSWSG